MLTERPALIAPVAAAAAILASGLCGLLIVAGYGLPLAALVLAGAAIWLLTTQLGAVVVIAPAFLFPAGLGPLPMSITTLIAAVIYWAYGAGRPRLSWTPLAAVALLALVPAWRSQGIAQMVSDIGFPMIWAAGVILGVCLYRNPRHLWWLGAFCVPLVGIAVWEAMGNPNPWEAVTGPSPFEELGSIAGETRSLSTFGHPLIAGGVFAITAALFLHAPTRWRNVFVPILVVGTITTVSRSALLGIIAGAAVMVAQSGRTRWRALGGAALAVAVGWLAISLIPQVSESFAARFRDTGQQPVRHYAQLRIERDYSDPQYLIGGGFHAAQDMLQRVGGIKDFITFDNWYVTAFYDYGAIPLLAALALFAWGLWKADPLARRFGLPAVVTATVVLYFTDGMYYRSTALVAAIAVGVATAGRPPRRSPAPSPETR